MRMGHAMKTKTPAAMGTGVFVEAMKIRLYYGYRLGDRILNSQGGTCFNGNLRRREPLLCYDWIRLRNDDNW